MSQYHAYLWSVPDWRVDEMYSDLDNREQGIYRNLIDECWVKGSIPADLDRLARFVREPVDYFTRAWAKMRFKFEAIQEGQRLISPRLEEDRRRFMRNAKFTRKNARKAANVRWAKHNAEKALHAGRMLGASFVHPFEHHHTHTQGEEGIPLAPPPNLLNSPLGNTRGARVPEPLFVYGEFQAVQLTHKQHEKLLAKMDGNLPFLIDDLDRYSQTHPKQFKAYKNHYAVLLTWYATRVRKGEISERVEAMADDRGRIHMHRCEICQPAHPWQHDDDFCFIDHPIACPKAITLRAKHATASGLG